MRRLQLDYDPLSGTTEFLEFQDDKMRIVRSQDVSPILDTAKFLANDEEYTRTGIKRDEWHYARIPNVIMEEMKAKHHADWNDKEDKGHKKFFSVLNPPAAARKTRLGHASAKRSCGSSWKRRSPATPPTAPPCLRRGSSPKLSVNDFRRAQKYSRRESTVKLLSFPPLPH